MEPEGHGHGLREYCGGASSQSCGLLDAEEDLRIFWLALRTEGHANVVHSILLRDSSSTTSSSYAHVPTPAPSSLFANVPGDGASTTSNSNAISTSTSPRVVYVPNLNLPWAAELKAYVKKRFGIVLISVNSKPCPLRAREIFDILARPCYGARWNQLVRSFYPELPPHCARLNAAVFNSFFDHDSAALPRIANLARLAYLNRLLAALRRKVSELQNRRDTLRKTGSPNTSFKSTPPTVSPSAPSPSPISPPRRPHYPNSNASTPRTPGPATPHASKLRRHCLVQAEPVRSSASSSVSNPREYIVGGICVPAHLLNAVESSLVRDYRLYIQVPQSAHPRYAAAHFANGSLASLANHGTALLDLPPVCNVISPLLEPLPPAITPPPLPPSASAHMFQPPPVSVSSPSPVSISPPMSLSIPPPPLLLGAPRAVPPVGTTRGSPRHLREHRSVDEYLRNCFGVGWTSVCNAAIRNARRQQRERQLGEICAALAHTEEALSTGNIQRKRLVDKAVQFDMASSGLTGYCALQLVQQQLQNDADGNVNGNSETRLNERNNLPFAVHRAVETARKRLKRLTDDDAVSLEAYH